MDELKLRPCPNCGAKKGIFDEKIKEAKSEAIKEFAELLKKNAQKFTEYDEGGWGCTVYAVKVEDIDNTVEGMTEEAV